ncbi:MAG TPA: sigma-70 family RNA polymerase sigma factor [Pyrinomonadaceae bacterium]|nr:sigma-70 family RNA polymerase sigma factor [Pyrinomonadaceae bacterium]
MDLAVAKSDKIAAPPIRAANMMMAATSGVTQLLNDWQDGDRSALEKLTPLIYEELRRIAHRYVQRERSGHTLQTTALVNEAYVRLAGHKTPVWQSRSHFFAVTAQVMRHILIDHARRRRYLKHGGQLQQVSLEEASLMTEHRAAELMALDEALDELKQFDSRKSKVVELRYFGGLSLEETATTLGMSAMTVRRDWRAAKAWLFRRMRESDRPMECAEHDAIAQKSVVEIARQSHDS